MSSRLLASVLVAVFVAGCGSSESPVPAAPATELTVTFWQLGRDGESVEASLTCAPAGGTHPDPEAACAALAANEHALSPAERDSLCTQIYGGPEIAEVSGVVRGREVDSQFNRTDGCEISRWDALDPLLRLRD